MSSFRIVPFSVALLCGCAPCVAASQPAIPQALQEEAMSCVGEAAQVCPEVWTAQDHGLACMTGKRLAFSPRCRLIYDKVAHVLGR
jgi:hypothetical protein